MGIVAIVGRPNVGKSTLFNRLVGMRQAIVDSTAGTTRDRHYGRTDWNGREFSVIDTGGYTVNGEDVFEEEIRRQVMLAIDEADVILFMTEVSTGITDLDMFMADILRRADKKVFLVVNKVDNSEQLYGTPEFYALGLGEPYAISSMSGSGTGDLMDAIVAALPPDERDGGEEELPRITIVGRPNVGKSTLFNRLVGMRQAIVDSTAGTTRDRHYGRTDWNGREFSVIDTGGYTVNGEDVFEEEIRRQVMLAIDEADVILFMTEVSTGITDLDMFMADILRRADKKVFLVVNKVDNSEQLYGTPEFYALGLGEPYAISSMSGSGTGDLMDAIVAALPPDERDGGEEELPRITIVGRPNVGKSSMTNALLGQERNIVTPVAGTTRDSIHTRYNKYGMDFYLIDTAGLRKKGKVTEDLEFYSVMRSIRAIESSDVCILMLDASQGVESQDLNIFNLIVRNRKGCVIVVNKWDLIPKDSNTMKEWRAAIAKKLAPFSDVPVIFTSVPDRQRILEVLQTALRVYRSRARRIPTSEFNDYILPIIEETPPPSIKGKYIRIKYAAQLPNPTPVFAFFVNLPQYIKDTYRRFLENKIREHWDFSGVPIQIYFRQK